MSKVFPPKVGGAWVLKSTRFPIEPVFADPEAGMSIAFDYVAGAVVLVAVWRNLPGEAG